MSRCLGIALAGALLLAAESGCSLDAFLSPFGVWCVYGPKTVADGSVSRVCARLQDGLSDAGILVQMNRVGSAVRLAGLTKSGRAFCLHLYPKPDGGGKKTLVHVKWDHGGDEAFWQLVHKILTTPAPDTDDDPHTSLAIPIG